MNKFEFLKVYNSPFKRLKLSFYIGKIAIGTPYFFPRNWVQSKQKEDYLIPIPKKIGFDFVGLGWKLKWTDTDYRFEWSPVWSFVFFKWQIAIIFNAPEAYHYWESWLYFERNTDKTKSFEERIKECRIKAPQTWTRYKESGNETIDYYDLILKEKYKKTICI